MKTREELNALRDEVAALNKKLAELNEEELKLVVGGISGDIPRIVPDERYVMSASSGFELPDAGNKQYEFHVYTVAKDKTEE